MSQCPTGVADSESRRARPPRSGGFLALPFSSSQDRARSGRLGPAPANGPARPGARHASVSTRGPGPGQGATCAALDLGDVKRRFRPRWPTRATSLTPGAFNSNAGPLKSHAGRDAVAAPGTCAIDRLADGASEAADCIVVPGSQLDGGRDDL